MAYTTLPEADAVRMARTLGLLVSQAGIYGAQHNVTQTAAQSVFVEAESFLKTYGPVEFTTSESHLLINGIELGATALFAGKNLLDRMTLYKIGGFVLTPPLDAREFLYFVKLFGTPPQALAAQGGFEAVLKKAGFRSVQAVSVSYQRVTGDAPPPSPDAPKAGGLRSAAVSPKAAEASRPAAPRAGVLDLSDALEGFETPGGAHADAEEPAQPAAAESPSSSSRRQRTQAVAAMLRDAAAALEEGGAEDPGAINTVLDKIRDILSDMAAGSRRGIANLANDLEEDSKTIASIESAARRRGIGLKLTRGELLQRYAELNQEIVQPLTVSSGVIDLLHSGKTGELSESQLELLNMAAESMGRVSQLVNYLNRVSGLPESLTPDAGVISDSYR